jgi:deoxycytidylate deaminase
MLALYPSSTDVSWSYYAEQYARLRGCNVAPTGAILIDSRTDGEILKVPCNGADSMIVQCQNGDCRGLL